MEWLRQTRDESTRPADFDLSDNPAWRGLQILDAIHGGPNDTFDIVESWATCLDDRGGFGVLHESSRFLKDNGRGYYLDGEARQPLTR